LLNLNLTGIRGGLVLAVCDDPGGISSTNEQDSRLYAKMGNLPLFEPSDFQEAKDMMVAAFELSEEIGLPCIVHSVTRISHARGNVALGPMPTKKPTPAFDRSKPFSSLPYLAKSHQELRKKLTRSQAKFESSPFNDYRGPDAPELLIVTTGAGLFYCEEAIHTLDIRERVGIIKLGTTWPLPEQFLFKQLSRADKIVFIEEGSPFIEGNVKERWVDLIPEMPPSIFIGKIREDISPVGELNPDIVIGLLQKVLDIPYQARPKEYADAVGRVVEDLAPLRDLSFCAGCPHRATYWAVKKALILDGRDGFVLGDIGCYGMGFGPAGYTQMNTLHAMGSGAGVASGMGQLYKFGMKQPMIAVCGDSTFFHAAIPAIVNAQQHGANFVFLILDNDATAMTGFQPHPGLGKTATGHAAPPIDIDALCRGMGLDVEIQDPYDLEGTTETLMRLLKQDSGVKVLILKRACALVRAKKGPADYHMAVSEALCLGESCGCNRFCTRIFKCPGLFWDIDTGRAQIDEAICNGCGVCSHICPTGAISKEAV
jgi:indolepyruvate ferredoxin oxidoreductase alpha subunit